MPIVKSKKANRTMSPSPLRGSTDWDTSCEEKRRFKKLSPSSISTWSLIRISGIPRDSLAEAYLELVNRDLAIENFKKSLELNPGNSNAREMLMKLER
jgi:hypothetical protein